MIGISDALGRVHYLRKHEGLIGENLINLQDLRLEQGVYMVTLRQGDFRMSKKVVVIKP